MYIALFMEDGSEAPVARQYSEFNSDGSNITPIAFQSVDGKVVSIGISKYPSSAVLVRVPLTPVIRVVPADIVALPSFGIKVDQAVAHALWGRDDRVITTFAEWTEANPRLTSLKEVWDAAFRAGSQVTHTLLTGEPE